ncbi:hypothetical protein SDC9_67005 [bioreactor metagenome]|uniref:Uncharacterized protein n=1 Tax=bioreactor metagenome TaxID=1076179 RepID=A0A644Y351_9ZZZZ
MGIQSRTNKFPNFPEKIGHGCDNRHPECGRHVDKKWSGQVDVNQLDGEFLRKEIIRQVKRFSDRP